MPDDKIFLRRAIELAASGIKQGGGPFGAVISQNDKIIAESNNKVVLNTDPTAHAEVLAIREAARVLGTHDLKGCVLYSSCEPCPMCLGAIYWSGMERVVFASGRHDAAAAGFNDEMIYDEIALDPSERHIPFQHMEENEAKELFRKWEEFDGKVKY
jgi:guanine deaminase